VHRRYRGGTFGNAALLGVAGAGWRVLNETAVMVLPLGRLSALSEITQILQSTFVIGSGPEGNSILSNLLWPTPNTTRGKRG